MYTLFHYNLRLVVFLTTNACLNHLDSRYIVSSSAVHDQHHADFLYRFKSFLFGGCARVSARSAVVYVYILPQPDGRSHPAMSCLLCCCYCCFWRCVRPLLLPHQRANAVIFTHLLNSMIYIHYYSLKHSHFYPWHLLSSFQSSLFCIPNYEK